MFLLKLNPLSFVIDLVVHSLDDGFEFVFPVYEKGSDCFALRFDWVEVQTHCRAIQIATETDSFLYTQLISTGEEAFNFPVRM